MRRVAQDGLSGWVFSNLLIERCTQFCTGAHISSNIDHRSKHHNSNRPAALQYPEGINKNFIHDLCLCRFVQTVRQQNARVAPLMVGQTPIQIYSLSRLFLSSSQKPSESCAQIPNASDCMSNKPAIFPYPNPSSSYHFSIHVITRKASSHKTPCSRCPPTEHWLCGARSGAHQPQRSRACQIGWSYHCPEESAWDRQRGRERTSGSNCWLC